MTQKRIVIAGNGMVGHKLVEALVEAGATAQATIIVLGEEPRPAYDRVHLSEFFSGKTAEELSLVTPGFYEQPGLELRLGIKVTAIDRVAKQLMLSDGQTLGYDALVLATGSYPFVPPLPGRERADCFVYRTIEDLEAMTASGKQAKTGVVIGGGLLGLECAKALKDMGLRTHVVEFAPRLMAVQIDDGGGRVLRRKIEELGVTVHTQKNTLEIVDGETGHHRMKFADGSHLDADMIVFSAGIRPRDELARQCGLSVGERGGIVVDDLCRTSDPSIYAIGECALHNGRIYGLVAPGYEMARVAAKALLDDDDARFNGADMSTKLKLLGVDVASIGDAHCATVGAKSYTFLDEVKQVYKKLVVSADHKTLLGAVLVGDAEDYGSLLQYMLNQMPLPERPEALILPSLDGAAKPMLGVGALPPAAQVCSCNNVTKGGICAAIDQGCTTLGALKTATKAATACGGCGPLVTQILKHELKARGVAVNNHLCEHFPYSRQELFHLVKLGAIKSFDDLIAKHGRGRGCDICKPTAASIFASCWNEHVLKPRHAKLQDSNDYYMANLQKDGTYSVVPRVPGGEITPDKLIAIGTVAKKYGLYTKITGGQRVDLFGAQVHELPLIWKELIDAGMESGHAYGKALRTVKSCVGSTWCRYGVQDSVGLAIELEERYRGIRSPHKIKFGVSGCTRECAEAQSKDFGIIATENGWNLYICGNGGMKPRHADLFVGDLDKETLIRYIDRLMMFYVRTADRLQRTSVWLESLEGGLDYLRKVVVDDSLRIGAELEADLQHLVATYECEWKKAINDPATMRRFRTFVNSDKTDQNVVFVQERGQIRPATEAERAVAAKAEPAL
ncbi:MAG: nitrite reductase large subunit NirB [Nevskia sp.]|nr:nitrite reductase large subunit NirB [Nevskia sp.]